jgi:hypothetical protein
MAAKPKTTKAQETKKAAPIIVIRFVLNLPTEETTYVDVEFTDEKQAKKAANLVMNANGALIALNSVSDIPVLLRTEYVAAAFPVEYEEDEGE